MKSTEQVPDTHRGSSLVLHYVTKVWSDVPWDWPQATTARRRSNGYISTIRLPEAPSNVTARVLADVPGAGIILAGYPDRPPEKADGPTIGTAELTRAGSGNSRMRGTRESVVMSKMLLRTPGRPQPRESGAAYWARIFRDKQQRPARTP
jgi:hypothetical protein